MSSATYYEKISTRKARICTCHVLHKLRIIMSLFGGNQAHVCRKSTEYNGSCLSFSNIPVTMSISHIQLFTS